MFYLMSNRNAYKGKPKRLPVLEKGIGIIMIHKHLYLIPLLYFVGPYNIGNALANEANAQAAEIMIPLDSGAEIVINLSGISAQVQGDVMATLQGCIDEGTTSRDECVAGFAKDIAQIRLNEIVRITHQQLVPLEHDIGLTAAEIIQEPVFCEYAPDENAAEGCTTAVGNVQLAAAELQFASVRERLIAAETRVARKNDLLESSELANDARLTRNTETAEALSAEKNEGVALDQFYAETNEELAVANAVLAALQRVVAENLGE